MLKIESNLPTADKAFTTGDLVGRFVYVLDRLSSDIPLLSIGQIKNFNKSDRQAKVLFPRRTDEVTVEFAKLRFVPMLPADFKAEIDLFQGYVKELQEKLDYLQESGLPRFSEMEFKTARLVKSITEAGADKEKIINIFAKELLNAA